MEQLIYISLLLVIIIAFGTLEQDIIKNFSAINQTNELRQSGRVLMTRINQEVKTARAIALVEDHRLVLRTESGSEEFYWNADEGNLYLDSARLNSEKITVSSLYFSGLDHGVVWHLSIAPSDLTSGDNLEFSAVANPRAILYN